MDSEVQADVSTAQAQTGPFLFTPAPGLAVEGKRKTHFNPFSSQSYCGARFLVVKLDIYIDYPQLQAP